MELRDLEYFAVVARHGNVARASEALGLSPPALSKSLRRLEAAVKAQLVERAPKGIALTNAGKALLGQIGKLRLSFEDVKREAADVALGRAGRLGVGASQADCETVTRCCTELLREAPRLTVELQISNNDVMVPHLRAGELDLIINILPSPAYDETIQERLFDDEIVVCASAAHPLAKRRRLTLNDLAKERWVLPKTDLMMRQALERAFREKGLPGPAVAIETRSVVARDAAIAHSDLVGLASTRMLRQKPTGWAVVRLPVIEPVWRGPIGVIYRKDAYVPPAARQLVERFRIISTRRAAR